MAVFFFLLVYDIDTMGNQMGGFYVHTKERIIETGISDVPGLQYVCGAGHSEPGFYGAYP